MISYGGHNRCDLLTIKTVVNGEAVYRRLAHTKCMEFQQQALCSLTVRHWVHPCPFLNLSSLIYKMGIIIDSVLHRSVMKIKRGDT